MSFWVFRSCIYNFEKLKIEMIGLVPYKGASQRMLRRDQKDDLENMIEIRNIKKGFADKTVIDDVSAVFETGKCNLIIGTSGSGKTVLMKCLVGLFEPDSGDIAYDGKNYSEMNEEHRKELRQSIGMLFQGSALFDSMTVEQNVLFPWICSPKVRWGKR